MNSLWHKFLWFYPKGVLYNWRNEFAGTVDFDLFSKRFLTPIDDIASSVFCPDKAKCSHSCDRNIMGDRKKAPEGACLKMLKPDLILAPADIIVCKLNASEFHKAIALAIGIEPYDEKNDDVYTWQIGSLQLKPGKRRKVFLSYRQEGPFTREIAELALSEKEPFIIFTFSHYDLPRETERALSNSQISRFSLDEILEITNDCQLKLLPSCSDIWGDIADFVKIEEKKQYRFNLPSGTDWEDVSIHFLDKHSISITVGGKEKVELLYNEMGMADKRNTKPTKDWHLLETLAASGGSLSWKSTKANQTFQQQKHRLIERLCSIFGLKSDPIPWDSEAKAYICRFKISPDTKSTIYHSRLRAD